MAAAPAREDAEELVAHSVPRQGLSRGAIHLSASRRTPGTGEHDRGVELGALPHLSESARLERPAVVTPADARLARTQWQAAARDRRRAMAGSDAGLARRPRRAAARARARRALRRAD